MAASIVSVMKTGLDAPTHKAPAPATMCLRQADLLQ